MMVKPATVDDAATVTNLALLLWPSHTRAALCAELTALLCDENARLALAMDGTAAVGFAQCQLRHDYVEGTSHSPVGYLEGIFVLPPYRGRGVARARCGAGFAAPLRGLGEGNRLHGICKRLRTGKF